MSRRAKNAEKVASSATRGKSGDVPTVRVEVDPRVDQRVRAKRTPKEVRNAYVDAYEDFGRRGCEAASYRLNGPDEWPRFCVKILPRNYRLVVIFPESNLARFILLEEHTNTADPYEWIEETFDLPGRENRGAGAAGKVSCCSDRADPPDGAVLAALLDELTRQRRSRRQR